VRQRAKRLLLMFAFPELRQSDGLCLCERSIYGAKPLLVAG
jgi:hypothetical protein